MGIKKTNLFRIWCKKINNDGTEDYFRSKICFKTKTEANKYADHLNSNHQYKNELHFFCRPEELCLASKANNIINSQEDTLQII